MRRRLLALALALVAALAVPVAPAAADDHDPFPLGACVNSRYLPEHVCIIIDQL